MTEQFKYKRVVFVKRTSQQKFMASVILTYGKGYKKLASSLHISQRSLQDWRKGKTRIPYEAAKKLSICYKIPLPAIKEIISLREHLRKISESGGRQAFKTRLSLPSTQEKRKLAWQRWWDEKGRCETHPMLGVRKSIFKPVESDLLAEFFGIMLGDGGITKYQVNITLNRHDDKEYIPFVSNLMHKLFKIKPTIIIRPDDPVTKSVALLQISRRELVDYLCQRGLVVGNKVRQQVSVPNWILTNEKFRLACLRGLVDTDGCMYTNTYTINAREYSYKKLAFTNRSIPLLHFAYETWEKMGLSPAYAKNIDVRITSEHKVATYMKLVGTSNPKHLKRYQI